MRKAVVPFVLSVGLIAVWAAPADAASTRAEYIGQVDPICQSLVDPHDAAVRAYNRSAKRMLHLSGSGTLKAWLAATRRASKLLTALTQVEVALLDQIAAVPPAAPDVGTIGTWLNGRRQSDALAASAAVALNRPVPQVGKFFKRIKQANSAFAAADRAIEGFGFQVCGVIV
jgi:hypothetical protein